MEAVRIHAALCRICGKPIKKAREQCAPALRPFYLPGFSAADVAHWKCANARHYAVNGVEEAFAAEKRKGVGE